MPKVRVDGVGIGMPQSATALRLIGLAVLVAASLAGHGASAQIPSGFSGSSSTMTMGGDEAYRTLAAFGNCYASQNSREALALIATEPGGRDEAETYRRLFNRENISCLGEATELSMPVSMVRGAIAEGLYERRIPLPANLVQSAPGEGAPVRTLSEAALCYAAAHPDRARALVGETRPGSRQELDALRAMAPDFFRCVPEAARNRRFNATHIRFKLAEALLRMAPTESRR